MELIKKRWWVFLVILIVPFGINHILLRPTPFSISIVGKDTDWLSFGEVILGL